MNVTQTKVCKACKSAAPAETRDSVQFPCHISALALLSHDSRAEPGPGCESCVAHDRANGETRGERSSRPRRALKMRQTGSV